MTSHYRRHQARLRFNHNLGRLRMELALGTERRHLDVLLELLGSLLEHLDGTLEAARYRAELVEITHAVESRSHLRVVK